MPQYIDKDALVAEINKRIIDEPINNIGHQRVWAYNDVKDIINTLEVKEVDLNRELDDYIEKERAWIKDDMSVEYNNGDSFNHIYDLRELAKHFFELGLKAEQTLEEIKIGETQIYLDDDGGEPPYDGKQWLDLGCTEYEIPTDKFIDGDNVEIIIRKTQKGEQP